MTKSPVSVICRQLIFSRMKGSLSACTRRTEGDGEAEERDVEEKKEGCGMTMKTPYRW